MKTVNTTYPLVERPDEYAQGPIPTRSTAVVRQRQGVVRQVRLCLGQLGEAVEAACGNIRSGNGTLAKAWDGRDQGRVRQAEDGVLPPGPLHLWRHATQTLGNVQGMVNGHPAADPAPQGERTCPTNCASATRRNLPIPAYVEALGDRMVQGFRKYDSLSPGERENQEAAAGVYLVEQAAEIEEERSAQGAS